MSKVKDLLGNTLIDGNQNSYSIEDALSKKKGFLLYFSASWCGPCKRFTPELKSIYENALQDQGEVIFVSKDKDESSFNEYLGKMPWKAVPFNSSNTKSLIEHFEINSIPALLSFDNEGNLLSREGRTLATNDPQAKKYPWKDEKIVEIIGNVIDKDGNETSNQVLKSKKYIALLFTAQWCPVQEPLEYIKQAYESLIHRGESVEFIYVSKDKLPEEFNSYFGSMPWKAIPFDRKGDIELLSKRLQITEIPSLITLDVESEHIITKEGTSAAELDPEGLEFPWETKLLQPLSNSSMGLMNSYKLLIVYSESKEVESSVQSIANKKEEEWKALGEIPLYMTFGNQDSDPEIVSQTKEFLGIEENSIQFAAIVDGEEGLLFTFSEEFTENKLIQFIDDMLKGKLSGISLG